MIKKRDRMYVPALELAVLVFSLHRAARHREVGFGDAVRTMEDMELDLNKPIEVKLEVVESALWAANLLDERGAFEHPAGLTFDQFVKKLAPKFKFNRNYNWLSRKWERGSDK